MLKDRKYPELLISVVLLLALTACSSTQIYSNTKYQKISLDNGNLINQGIAFLTPSTITGQEEDKQIIALVFTEILDTQRPEIAYLSLPKTLSAINDSGLSKEYKHMLLDYHTSGIFDKDMLSKIGQVTGMRYIAQLKLSDFNQESRGRFGAFGLRLVDTKQAHVRIFFQIWDSAQGTIAWEATEEVTYSQDTLSEKPISFNKIVSEAAKNLISDLP